MKKWFFLFLLMTILGYWALYEKEEQTGKIDGVSLPWTIDFVKKAHRIVLTQEDKKLCFLRHPTGYWWLLEPEKGMANQLNVTKWLNVLMMPKIMRWFTPNEEQEEELKKAISLEFDVGKDEHLKVKYYEPKERGEHAYLYIPTQNKILVLEKNIGMELDLNVENYRTILIFPFKTTAVNSMTYKVGERSFLFKKHAKGWEINFPMNKTWENFLKGMSNAACLGFVYKQPNDKAIASWEFEFESGDKSKLELFLYENKYVAFYRGREIGQVIGTNELIENFPGVVSEIK